MFNHIQTLFDYNYWAHRLVWDKCIMALTDEQFTRSLNYSIGSIHQQVVHVMSAEWMWFTRLQGDSPTVMLAPEAFPTRADVRAKWDDIETWVREYVNGLTAEALATSSTYRTMAGVEYTQNVAETLLHVVNHGTDHRAQILAMLHGMGVPTVAQDLLFYMRSR
jgi:uncharacterized damage-inducible protein DinB